MPKQEHEDHDNIKPAERLRRFTAAYLHCPRRPDGDAGRRAESRRGDREDHGTGSPAEQRTGDPASLGLYSALFLPACAAHRQSEPQNTHACIHTRSRPHVHTTPPPDRAHTFFILLPLLMADAFCSLLFPFSLSLSAPPFPFSISSFFLSGYTCSRLLKTAPTPSPPPSPSPPSLYSPPSHAASPSISSPLSLSLFGVCRARGHYLSHSGHVRWNGGVCSEQKQSELWGIVAGSCSLGNSRALLPMRNPLSVFLHALQRYLLYCIR